MSILETLLHIRAWVHKIQNAIEEKSEAKHDTQKKEWDKDMPTEPVKVVVSYDDQTIRDAKTEENKQHGTQNSIKNATWSAVMAAGIYALISLAIWCQMIKQSKIASAALRQSNESFRSDERAWVGLDRPMIAEVINYAGPKFTWSNGNGVIHPIETPNPLIHTGVSIKNFGKTPAFDVIVQTWSAPQEMLDTESNVECQFAEDFSSGKVIRQQAPHKGATWPTFGKTIFPGQEVTEPKDVPGGDIPGLFIVGCIAYRDAFNDRHKTRFCYTTPQVLVTDPAMKNGDAFAQCNQYNDAN